MPCICTSPKCGHANGEPCGQPTEATDLPAQQDDNKGPVGPWFNLGICEDCWKLNAPAWERITEKFFRLFR